MLDVARLLGYEDSPNFLRAEEDFPHAQELGYVLRKAKKRVWTKGCIRSASPERHGIPHSSSLLLSSRYRSTSTVNPPARLEPGNCPLCSRADSCYLRLYSGFRYRRGSASGTETNGILKASITFNEVVDQLAAFQANAIDDGTLWQAWGDSITPETRVDWTLLENLKNLDRYVQERGVSREVSHALIGKFVYFRYLRDRNILSDRKLAKWGIAPESVFSRHATVESFLLLDQWTHDWLNGSIFPLNPETLSSIAPSLFQQVAGAFMGDTVDGQLHLDFEPYNFSFIPIETLSVIYEQFLHLPEAGQDSSRGRESGAYYTPIPLIAFMQEELERKRPLTKGMQILDPACGSGAFLVQCYRRLIEKQLRQEESPIQPNALREILTTQIFGVERDGDACRVAELSLILTLLDYITPPDLENNTAFALPSLRNINIFEADFFDPDSAWAEVATTKKFDWVIGNPPWIELKSNDTRAEDHFVWQWMQANSKEAPTGGHQIAEAFVWKTFPYLKPEGVAGLVLPAMTLFKRESTAFRQRFFASVHTWCIANFSNLAEVLFAGRARRSALVLFFRPHNSNLKEDRDETILTYAPLVVNQEANRPSKPGRTKNTWNITINAAEIQEVPMDKAITGEMLPWKLAMWSCFRDGKLLEKVARKFPAFHDFAKSHGFIAHEGFQLRQRSAQSREPLEAKHDLEGKKRVDFTKLKGYRRIFVFPESAITIIPEELTYVRKGRAEIPMRVSTPPHIFVDAGRRFAVYSNEFIAVPARQIGIASSAGKEALLKALSLYLVSDFVIYQQFFTTPEWGISTSRATLDALKNLPVPLDNLSEKELSEWAELRDTLAELSQNTLESHFGTNVTAQAEQNLTDKIAELNDRVFRILGLREPERILIQDLVTINMQCIQGKVTKEVLDMPSESTILSYLQRLQKELDAFITDQPELQHEIIAHYDTRSAMIAIRLSQADTPRPPTIRAADTKTKQEFVKIRGRLKQYHNQWMYFNRNLRLYDLDTIYCFKPMQALPLDTATGDS